MKTGISLSSQKQIARHTVKFCAVLFVGIGLSLGSVTTYADQQKSQGHGNSGSQGGNNSNNSGNSGNNDNNNNNQSGQGGSGGHPSPTPRTTATPGKPSPTPRKPSPTPKPTPRPKPSPTPKPGSCTVCEREGGKARNIQIPCDQVDRYLREHPSASRGSCNVTPVTNR
jgi:hypothetical protein